MGVWCCHEALPTGQTALPPEHRKKVIGIDIGRRRRRVSLNKNSKDAQCTGGEKDWFQLLLEIERRFRAEERKNLRSKCEITPKPIKEPSVGPRQI
jgi:hypothetical protein